MEIERSTKNAVHVTTLIPHQVHSFYEIVLQISRHRQYIPLKFSSARWQVHRGCCEPEGPKGFRASLGSRLKDKFYETTLLRIWGKWGTHLGHLGHSHVASRIWYEYEKLYEHFLIGAIKVFLQQFSKCGNQNMSRDIISSALSKFLEFP